MDLALKAGLFLGTVLLVGAGIFRRWVAPEALSPRAGWFIVAGLALGAALLVAGSLGDVLMTVTRILRGRIDTGVFFDYLLTTRHGEVILVRLGLALLLAFWGARTFFPKQLDGPLYALFSLGLLATLSLLSHSGVMGPLPFLGDLMHLVAATLWPGAVLYLAWLPIWADLPALKRTVRRVSAIGLASVGLITLTGIYLATLHLFGLSALTTTSYGLALTLKSMLVLVILAIAGVNRWLLVPWLERRGDGRPLRLAVRCESVLLVGVLFATGVLATREPAHEHGEEHPTVHDLEHEAIDHLAHLEPSFASGELPALAIGPAREADLELMSPSGAVSSPVLQQGMLELPALEPGIWRLRGDIDGESLELPLTLLQAEGETGLVLTAFFVPTPMVSQAGESRMYVHLEREGRTVEAPVLVSYRMPGMVHSGDDDLFELDYAHAHHGAPARQGSLRFPMAGRWDMTITVPEEGEIFVLEVEALDE
jgi:putative copper export protein